MFKHCFFCRSFMKRFLFSLLFSCPLFCGSTEGDLFHKTVGQVEVYKEKDTLRFRSGRIRRLTKNLLTPIHSRKSILRSKTEKHLVSKSKQGPLTIKFLLPLSLKEEILKLIAKDRLTLMIPFSTKEKILTSNVEIDRYTVPPKGLFACKSRIESDLLTPSEVILIHLLKGDI